MRPSANPAGNPREASSVPVVAENINPPPAVPPAPSTLEELGRTVWAALWDAGGPAYYPPTDRFVIERYCSLHDRRKTFLDILDRDGAMILGSQGQEVLHPASRALDSVEKELRAIEDRLGLNPEARARLGIVTIEHKSKLDAFLEGEELT